MLIPSILPTKLHPKQRFRFRFVTACLILPGFAWNLLASTGSAQAPKPQGNEAKQNTSPSPWQQFQTELEKKAEAEKARLFPTYKTKYLADLKLPYLQNQEFLDGLLNKLRGEDPDLIAFLLEQLRKPGNKGWLDRNTFRLIEQKDPLLIRNLILWGLSSKNPRDRIRSLEILAKSHTKGLLPLLKVNLQEAPPNLLGRILRIYEILGTPEVAPILIPYLNHGDPKVRIGALRALTSIASPEIFQTVFEKGLGLPDGSKEELLLQYLAKIGGKTPKAEHLRALTHLLELELPRAALDQALELAAHFPPPDRKSKARLDQALERWLSHPGVKVQAARAMASHGTKTGVKKVLSELGRFIRKNRRVPYGYIQRARAYLAFGRYAEALKDAKEALRFSKNKADLGLFLLAAEIELRRGKPLGVLRYLKEGELPKEMLQQFRRDHPEIEAFLKTNSRLRRFFRSK